MSSVISKLQKIRKRPHRAACRFSHNVATPVPHPRSPRAARGDSSGLPERPKRGLPRIYRPLFGRSSRPNAPVEFGFHHMIGSGRCISGVPGVIRKGARLRCRLPGGKIRERVIKTQNIKPSNKIRSVKIMTSNQTHLTKVICT